MATASVHCPTCNVDTTFQYPDDYSTVTDPTPDENGDPTWPLIWEHGCPPYQENPDGSLVLDGEGNPVPQEPYKGVFDVPGPTPPSPPGP
jgi:hypothetical protein